MLRNSPYLLLVLATCIWGGNFVAGKALVTHMPPLTLAALRWCIAFVCLLPFYGKEAWQLRKEALRHYKMILFLAVTGVAGFNTLTYVAVQYTGSINASLMNSATPIMVVILSWLMYRERIAWSALPGIILSMAGVCWIIGRGSLGAILGLSFNKGDLWMLVAILCWSLYTVGMKRAGRLFPASPFLLIQVTLALIVLIPLSAGELLLTSASIDWSPSLLAGLLYVGLFASIVAFLSWNRAIELAGPQRCAGFLNLIPLFSAIFATGFTGESLHLYHLLGAVLIVAGVYATNLAMKRAARLRSQI
ncbi:DMT family transporter [Paenibacillus hexagrammi]|uniref:DMT family transporter n=1 Tax=Paenibacillus hexagrammi TaxID=2908839 RepID=A0ABY3SIL4_9BACL|nr:DMT family transporter [Paenibacillus sp. YPD9-1]UJF33869.1 DMT family transporter [Paenibacillus sp. YPD9-1]